MDNGNHYSSSSASSSPAPPLPTIESGCFNCTGGPADGKYCTTCFENLFEKQFNLKGGGPQRGPPKAKPPPVPPKPTSNGKKKIDQAQELNSTGAPAKPVVHTKFVCAKCSTSLHGKTVETLSPGQLVCRPCYDSNIPSIVCTYCSLPFTSGNTLVTYNNLPYHQKCFTCTKCSLAIGLKSFCNTNSQVICEDCYFAKSGKICVGCGGTLTSIGFLFKDQPWHKSCFVCSKCKLDLGEKEVFLKDGLFCNNCYKEAFVGKCAKCHLVLDGEIVEYEGKDYHNNCFCCSSCLKPFGESSFIPREGKVYCETCFCINYGKQCHKCGLTISPTSGNGVVFRSEHYHRECFACTKCERSLSGQMVHSNKEDVKQEPYCGECYDFLFSKRCFSCRKIISGVIGSKYIAHEGKHWHEECFNCKICQSSLVNRKMLVRGDDVICGPCATYNI